ncbi:MAG: MFS transporter [Halobacteriales archaeon]|nr:MFS transporter [Halobacteriales archaeon]
MPLSVGERIGWSYRHAALSLCVLSYLGIRFTQLVISPLVLDIVGTFDTTRAAIGTALTGMWAAYALAQLPSGVFADRFGGRRVVLLSLAVTGLSGVVAALAPTFLLFGGGVILLGVGAGLYYNAATALLTRLFDGYGTAIGTHRIGSQLAGVTAPITAVAVAVRVDWRWALVVGGAVPLVVLGGFAVIVRPTAAADTRTTDIDWGILADILRRPAIAYTTGLAVLGEFTALATMAFLPAFLQQFHGFSTSAAGTLFAGYSVIIGTAGPISGAVSDRFGRQPTIIGTMVAGVTGYFLLIGFGGLAIVLVGTACIGIAMSWIPPIQSRIMDLLGADERGVGFGVVRTCYILLGSIGTTVVGTAADVSGWGLAFGVLGVLHGVAAVSLLANRLLGLQL